MVKMQNQNQNHNRKTINSQDELNMPANIILRADLKTKKMFRNYEK